MSGNVVDFKGRSKKKNSGKPAAGAKEAPVIDMTERRQEIIVEERRKTRRTILSSFIGAFVIVPRKGLVKVALYDISENGLSFDIDSSQGQFPLKEEVAMRVYLSQDIYFPIQVKIQNARAEDGEGVFRHGALFVKNASSDLALQHFVKFIESVSQYLQVDQGDHVSSGGGSGR
jgi:hypothetical protein